MWRCCGRPDAAPPRSKRGDSPACVGRDRSRDPRRQGHRDERPAAPPDPDRREEQGGAASRDGSGAKGEVTLSRKAKRIGSDFSDIKRRTGLSAVSAYSFRHQVSADMKAAGADPQDIARVLGHASERTQGRYGKPGKGRAGGGIILDAIASREVRTGRPGPGSNQPSLDG